MTRLTLDTSMARCSVALSRIETGEVLAADQRDMERGQAEALAPMADLALKKADLAYADLRQVVVTTGPGSFTGVRIGLSFAKGLGLALNIPVVGIDSLAAIAFPLRKLGKPVAVVVDARLGQYYFSLFNKHGIAEMSPCLLGLTAILALLPEEPLVLAGTGAAAVRTARRGQDEIAGALLDLPRAGLIAGWAAAPAAGAGYCRGDPLPLYLRTADAKPQGGPLRPVQDLRMRLALPEDFGRLAEIHGACFSEGWSLGSLNSLLATPGTFAMLANVDDTTVGFVIARLVADEAEIISLGVEPSWQRRKVGQALLAALRKHLQQLAAVRLFLEVAADNVAAIALYRGHGFHQIGERKNYYARAGGPAVNALVLQHEISHG